MQEKIKTKKMKDKKFNGKAIYQPAGKAAEYSKWACNFYVGCSNGCTYCYCNKGILAVTIGGSVPTLKKCFKNELHMEDIYTKEVIQNRKEIKKHGIFLSFTTDPCLHETIDQTIYFTRFCVNNGIPVKILTKSSNMLMKHIERFWFYSKKEDIKRLVAFGFTLTGHDELEPNASTNAERIEAMKKLHDAGFKTWASIEPIIDFNSSWQMIRDTCSFCDLYKIGLESGRTYIYKYAGELRDFMDACINTGNPKIYFKDSLLQQAGIKREDLPNNCVNRDYNMFI
jgi:DNA repair photolyase